MNHRPDHPLVRRDLSCPLCGSFKRGGLVACDDCFYDIWKTGSDCQREEAEERLDTAEDALEAREELGFW